MKRMRPMGLVKRVCAESKLLEQLSIYFRRMTGKLTDAGTHPLPGVLGKRLTTLRFYAARGPSAVGLSSPDVGLT